MSAKLQAGSGFFCCKIKHVGNVSVMKVVHCGNTRKYSIHYLNYESITKYEADNFF